MTARTRGDERTPEPAAAAVRLAVLDIDGTLLDPAGLISARVREAVRAASAAGCLVTLASGRRLWAVRPIVEQLGIDTPVILYNGAIVYDVGREETMIGLYLECHVLHDALDEIWSHGFQPVLYGHPAGGERVYTGPAERDAPATLHYFDRPTVQPLRLGREDLCAIEQAPLLAAMGDEEEVRSLQTALSARSIDCQTLVERQTFVPRSRWWQVDVSARGCSKSAAVRRLCQHFGVSHGATLAVGDGINDLDLVRDAGLGVAMGNAVAEVRSVAAAVVADNGHDGAAEALERFVLGGQSRDASTGLIPRCRSASEAR